MSDDRLITHYVEEPKYSFVICFVTDAEDTELHEPHQLSYDKAVMWMFTTRSLYAKLLLLGTVTNVIESEIRDFRAESFTQFLSLSKHTTKYMVKLVNKEIEFYIRKRLKELDLKIQ